MRNLSDPVTLVWARAGLYSDWRGYTVKVRLSNGRTLKWRAPMSLRSKDAAEKWAHQRWENQATKETKQLTVEQVDDLWKEYRFQKVGRTVKGISMATYESDRTDMKNHILPQLGGEIMEGIPILQLRQWMMYLNRKNLSSHSIRSIRNTLSRCYEDAILNEWISLVANPMQHPSIKEAMPVVRGLDLRTVVHISIHSLYRLLDSERIPQKWKTYYALGGFTGMDIGEILGLQWKHLHLKCKIPFVRVLQACQSRNISGYGKLGPTKRPSRIRTIPLHPDLVQQILKWRPYARSIIASAKGNALLKSDPVFPSPSGDHHYADVSPHLRKHLKQAKCPTMFAGNPITFKSLRRSFATWLYENDVDYSLIKDLMGHSKNDVTDFHYIDCKLDKKYRAVCTLQRITKPAKRQSRKGADVVYYDHNPEVYFEN